MASINTAETMERFNIGSLNTTLQLFKIKGSPAFKVGKNWMVDEEDFKKFLLKQSEQFKG